ncbi:MAG: WecB/TagA/CpsF family glycosyltransferase [bacterium]
METLRLFDLPIRDATLPEAVEWLVHAPAPPPGRKVYFVNAHGVNMMRSNRQYREALRRADGLFADGTGMRWAARALGRRLRDNVNGTDLYPLLCPALQKRGWRIFLLGAQPGIAEQMRERTVAQYPGLNICGTHHGHFLPEENDRIIHLIRESKTDLLLVAMGIPKQELWLDRHLEATGARAGLGVGGLFNFYSGTIPRAPLWMRRAGLEWLHRLYQEPGRLWKRYLIGNGRFLRLVVQEWMKHSIR